MTAEHIRQCPKYPEHVRRFHLLGVCGTGMGALAVLLQSAAYAVSGSDTGFYPPMSDILKRIALKSFEGWSAEQLEGLDPEQDIVIVGNVCRCSNEAYQAALAKGLCCLSLPEVLYHFFLKQSTTRLVITGTHGKTTTSAMIQAIFDAAHEPNSFFIGGELKAFGLGARLSPNSPTFIIEGDEYDSACFDKVPKFWHYQPTLLAINNLEFDHADIYPNVEAIEAVFAKLLQTLKSDAQICYNLDDPRVYKLVEKHANCQSYSLSTKPGSDFYIDAIEQLPHGSRFKLHAPASLLREALSLECSLSGMHNVYNAAMAASLALLRQVPPEAIWRGLSSYAGVKKRQEQIADIAGIQIYDDFAHHPSAVRETIRAMRLRFPKARLWGVFEMKSNTSRRAVFQNDYTEALAACDRVILSAPWRKDDLPPAELIDIPRIVDELNARAVPALLLPEIPQIVEYLVEHCQPGDIVLGMSGSSFAGFHPQLAQALQNKYSTLTLDASSRKA